MAIVTVSIDSYKCVLQLTWDLNEHDLFNAFLLYKITIRLHQIVLVVRDKVYQSVLSAKLLMMFSVFITTKAVSSNPAQPRCTRYNIMG